MTAMDTDGELPSVDDFLLVAEIAEAELKRYQASKAAFEEQQQARKAAEGRRKQLQRYTTARYYVSVKMLTGDNHVKVHLRVLKVCPTF
jgi:flagellar basal body rod protein FlgB